VSASAVAYLGWAPPLQQARRTLSVAQSRSFRNKPSSVHRPEPPAHDPHQLEREKRRLTNHEFEATSVNRRGLTIGLRHHAGTSRTGVDQCHLAEYVPFLDGFQQLIADRDLRSTGGQDEHAVTIITLFKNHVTGLLSDPLGRCRDQPRKVLVLGHRSLRPLRTKPIGCLFRIRTMPDVCTERPSGIVAAAPDNAALLMADCAAFQRVRQVGEI
jgi:hypothetical protein